MCRPATCHACGKASYAGCGQHVEQVLAGVPTPQRCRCTAEQKAVAKGGGLLSRIFGR
jgi:hypothetical protein